MKESQEQRIKLKRLSMPEEVHSSWMKLINLPQATVMEGKQSWISCLQRSKKGWEKLFSYWPVIEKRWRSFSNITQASTAAYLFDLLLLIIRTKNLRQCLVVS